MNQVKALLALLIYIYSASVFAQITLATPQECMKSSINYSDKNWCNSVDRTDCIRSHEIFCDDMMELDAKNKELDHTLNQIYSTAMRTLYEQGQNRLQKKPAGLVNALSS